MLFQEVIGQNSIKEKIIHTVLNDRISHAQLFHGKLGAGTFAMALALSRFVFCSSKTKTDSCGTCPSCLKINSLTHPDLHFSFPVQLLKNRETADDFIALWREMILANPYSNEQDWYAKNDNENKKGIIGVKESESVFKKLNMKSYEGGYKICIFWLAENMNTPSANKLLKLIEEPPDRTLLFLVAEDIQQILPTILSRTQVVKFNTLSEKEMVETMVRTNEVTQDKAIEIASYVNGDYSLALNEIAKKESANVFFDMFVQWMRLCFKKDVAGAVSFSADAQKLGKEKQKAFLLFVLNIFQKSLVGSHLGMDAVKTSETYKDFIQKFMTYIHERNIESLHTEMSEAHYHIDRNANSKILFLDLSFTLFKLIKK
jgi:DNA polymerase-3 subunit delta'